MTVTLLLGAPGSQFYVNGNTYQADLNGAITGGVVAASGAAFSGISLNDLSELISAGATYGAIRSRMLTYGVIAAASAALVLASGALSNGSKAVAANPDVPRPLSYIVVPGAAITAGTLTLVYLDHNGQTVTDVLSLVMGNVTTTLAPSRAVSRMTSQTVAALAGGSAPTIQGGTTAVLAAPTDVGATGVTFFKALTDNADATLPTQSATGSFLFTPATAPNGTHTYGFGYTFYSP